MPTSGSINFSVTRDDIITEALELCGVLGEGELPNTNQLASCGRTLNMLVKSLQAEGLNLFAVRRMYVFMQGDQSEYPLSNTASTHFTSSYGTTTTTSASTIGNTTLAVTSASDMQVGDYIGVVTDNNTIFWSTINTIDVPNLDVIMNDALTADTSAGATVYFYTTRAQRPMTLMESYILRNGDTRIPVEIVSRREYFLLNSIDSEGVVNQCYYDPQIGAGTLFVWPKSQQMTDVLVCFVQATLEDLDNANDNPEFPQEWYLVLATMLANLLTLKYGVPPAQASMIKAQADEWHEKARGFDSELYTSVYFQPASRWNR